MRTKIQVLDHGFVELVDHMGDDLKVANSARVSYGKRKDILDDKDIKLIRSLAKNHHTSPFRHNAYTFHCKVPEFVARQWYKHVVGIAYTECPTNDHGWNEISGRYLDASEFDYYVPDIFRADTKDNKQASVESDEVNQGECRRLFEDQIRDSKARYKMARNAGMSKEQARGLLPVNFYTEFYWTVSLHALVHFVNLRLHPGAQYEIQLYAHALQNLACITAPVSFYALLDSLRGVDHDATNEDRSEPGIPRSDPLLGMGANPTG